LPRKIRQLKADLRRAGYALVPRRGKGSHTVWAHPLVPDYAVTLPGHDGDDAKPYLEAEVREALQRASAAEQAARVAQEEEQ
jgi:predicted RNA binding protein YcfA (HicA-like mRNA interferase family)